MLLVPADLGESDALTCDVCIVGGGTAGIALARKLGAKGIDVICISGGGSSARREDQDLYRGHIPREKSHEPLEMNRVRVLGGSTTLWGGRLVPLDPIDFQARDYVPLSGWPIRYGDMAAYLPEAAALCESPESNFEATVTGEQDDLPSLLGDSISTNRCERWSTPTNFGSKYAAELKSSEQVRVLLDQHCVDIRLDDACRQVTEVRIRSRGGPTQAVRAGTFVLACGGLENPRLLLAARDQMPAGVGNQNDMVGRCYMGHMDGTHGWLRMDSRRLPAFYRLMRDEHGMYFRRRLWLTAEAQRREGVMNAIAFPFRPELSDASHRDPVLSLLFLKELRDNPQRRAEAKTAQLVRHLRNLLLASPAAWLNVTQQFWRRFRNRPRVPFLMPYRRENWDALFFQCEHAPNKQSRLVLTEQRDEFNMPRLEPRMAFSEIDTETVVRFYALLDQGLRESKLGRVEYTQPQLREYLQSVQHNYRSHAHHLGTTRMAANSRDGVVDADCRVHGLENLYIAGSSVFATAGHANPTLTLLALTLRLADHLVDRAGRIRASSGRQQEAHSG